MKIFSRRAGTLIPLVLSSSIRREPYHTSGVNTNGIPGREPYHTSGVNTNGIPGREPYHTSGVDRTTNDIPGGHSERVRKFDRSFQVNDTEDTMEDFYRDTEETIEEMLRKGKGFRERTLDDKFEEFSSQASNDASGSHFSKERQVHIQKKNVRTEFSSFDLSDEIIESMFGKNWTKSSNNTDSFETMESSFWEEVDESTESFRRRFDDTRRSTRDYKPRNIRQSQFINRSTDNLDSQTRNESWRGKSTQVRNDNVDKSSNGEVHDMFKNIFLNRMYKNKDNITENNIRNGDNMSYNTFRNGDSTTQNAFRNGDNRTENNIRNGDNMSYNNFRNQDSMSHNTYMKESTPTQNNNYKKESSTTQNNNYKKESSPTHNNSNQSVNRTTNDDSSRRYQFYSNSKNLNQLFDEKMELHEIGDYDRVHPMRKTADTSKASNSANGVTNDVTNNAANGVVNDVTNDVLRNNKPNSSDSREVDIPVTFVSTKNNKPILNSEITKMDEKKPVSSRFSGDEKIVVGTLNKKPICKNDTDRKSQNNSYYSGNNKPVDVINKETPSKNNATDFKSSNNGYYTLDPNRIVFLNVDDYSSRLRNTSDATEFSSGAVNLNPDTVYSESLRSAKDFFKSPVERASNSNTVSNSNRPIGRIVNFRVPAENTNCLKTPTESSSNLPVKNTDYLKVPVEKRNNSNLLVENANYLRTLAEKTDYLKAPLQKQNNSNIPVERINNSNIPVENTIYSKTIDYSRVPIIKVTCPVSNGHVRSETVASVINSSVEPSNTNNITILDNASCPDEATPHNVVFLRNLPQTASTKNRLFSKQIIVTFEPEIVVEKPVSSDDSDSQTISSTDDSTDSDEETVTQNGDLNIHCDDRLYDQTTQTDDYEAIQNMTSRNTHHQESNIQSKTKEHGSHSNDQENGSHSNQGTSYNLGLPCVVEETEEESSTVTTHRIKKIYTPATNGKLFQKRGSVSVVSEPVQKATILANPATSSKFTAEHQSNQASNTMKTQSKLPVDCTDNVVSQIINKLTPLIENSVQKSLDYFKKAQTFLKETNFVFVLDNSSSMDRQINNGFLGEIFKDQVVTKYHEMVFSFLYMINVLKAFDVCYVRVKFLNEFVKPGDIEHVVNLNRPESIAKIHKALMMKPGESKRLVSALYDSIESVKTEKKQNIASSKTKSDVHYVILTCGVPPYNERDGIKKYDDTAGGLKKLVEKYFDRNNRSMFSSKKLKFSGNIVLFSPTATGMMNFLWTYNSIRIVNFWKSSQFKTKGEISNEMVAHVFNSLVSPE